ncbi:MAG: elongation factor G [Fibrobacterota bacterium]
MKEYTAESIRNIGLYGHGHSGKTSLAEAMAFHAGAINKPGKVDSGGSVSDYNDEEIAKKMSIDSTLLSLEYNKKKLNIIDNPGFTEFFGEVLGSLKAVDTAMIVVCGASGVEVEAETAWEHSEKSGNSRIIFINKLDRENSDFQKVLAELKEKFGNSITPLQIPIGKEESFNGVVDLVRMKAFINKSENEYSIEDVPADLKDQVEEMKAGLMENAAESDETLMEKFFEAGELSSEEIIQGLGKGIAAGTLTPVLCGSAEKGIGIRPLVETLISYAPAPSANDSGKAAAFVFKTLSDQFVGRLSFLKILSGEIKVDQVLENRDKDSQIKTGKPLTTFGKKQIEIPSFKAGDICAISKLSDTTTNDLLAEKGAEAEFQKIEYPGPSYSVAIETVQKGTEDKLGTGLKRLSEEDPMFVSRRDSVTHQTVISGTGDAHLKLQIDRLKSRYGVEVETLDLKIPYKETIKKPGHAEYKHKKQSGGHGQYGHVVIDIEPIEEEYEFVDKIVGGVIPKGFIPGVEKGIKEAMLDGVLSHCPVVNVRTNLVFGSYHSVDSSEMAFKIAAVQAFKQAQQAAKPTLLEPVFKLEVTVPDSYTGDVMGDLNQRRGRVQGMDPLGNGKTCIKAEVPYSEILKYSIDLKALTQGRGKFTQEYLNYSEVPANLQAKIVEDIKAEQEAES